MNGLLEATTYYEYRALNDDRIEVTRSFSDLEGFEVREVYQRMDAAPIHPPELPPLRPQRVWPSPAAAPDHLFPL